MPRAAGADRAATYGIMMTIRNLFVFAVLFCASFQARALTPNIDLRDLVRFGSEQDRQEAQALIDQVSQSPAAFGLPAGITYPKAQLKAIASFAVSTLEVQNVSAAGYDLYAIFSSEKEIWLNKISVGATGTITEIKKTDLTRKPLSAQIDIFNRQLVLFDRKSGFLKYAPVSLGALVNIRIGDPNSGFQSLSSTFSRAILSRSKSELSRKEPDYYRGRPFLRIVDLDQDAYGGFTPFGLHYQISDVFERGFVSNGCFRLRDTDLYELATMVFLSRGSGVPISVVKSSPVGNMHPYPLIDSWYNMPRAAPNAKGKMELVTIEHGLFQFDKKIGNPSELLKP